MNPISEQTNTENKKSITKSFQEIKNEKIIYFNQFFKIELLIGFPSMILFYQFLIFYSQNVALKFAYSARNISIASSIIYFFVMFLSRRKFIGFYSLAIIYNILLDLQLLIMAGTFRTYELVPEDYLIFFLGIEVFLRTYLSINVYQNFKFTLDYSLIMFSYNSLLLWTVHEKINRSVISYFITKNMLFLLINLSTYILEKNLLSEHNSKIELEMKKNYYFSILDSMNVGLVTFTNTDSNYFKNKYFLDISNTIVSKINLTSNNFNDNLEEEIASSFNAEESKIQNSPEKLLKSDGDPLKKESSSSLAGKFYYNPLRFEKYENLFKHYF